MSTTFRAGLLALALAVLCGAAEPIESGLKVGQRPGPYTSIVSVGPQRGQLHCYICEAEDRPVAIVFARSTSDSLGLLVRGLDKAKADHKKADLRTWVTFLNADQPKFDPQVVAWGREQKITNVPLGVFEDLVGPPTYRVHRGAEVTVVLSVKQKVVRCFGFKDAALTEEQVREVVRSVEEIAKKAND